MRILFFCTAWGNRLPFPRFCREVRKAGYDGVETDLPLDEEGRRDVVQAVKDNGLLLIGQYWQSLESDHRSNLRNYRKHLLNIAKAGPYLINAQTGKDYFSLGQNLQHIGAATAISEDTGIDVVHETHRGKFLYSMPVFREAVRESPGLSITLDASHWCNVHESWLEDQEKVMATAIRATRHIHARVGCPEAPQVNDPRAPEWKEAVDRHFNWWDRVVERHRKEKRDLTVTPEFGPEPYMPLAPYSKKPLADQWKVNLHMMSLFKERYGNGQ